MKPTARVDRVLALAEPVLLGAGFVRSPAAKRTWIRERPCGSELVRAYILSDRLDDWKQFRLETEVELTGFGDDPTSIAAAGRRHRIATMRVFTGPGPIPNWEVHDGCDIDAVGQSLRTDLEVEVLPYLDSFHSPEGATRTLVASSDWEAAAIVAFVSGDLDGAARYLAASIEHQRSPFDGPRLRDLLLREGRADAERWGVTFDVDPTSWPPLLTIDEVQARVRSAVGSVLRSVTEGRTDAGATALLTLDHPSDPQIREAIEASGVAERFLEVQVLQFDLVDSVLLMRQMIEALEAWQAAGNMIWWDIAASETGVHIQLGGADAEQLAALVGMAPDGAVTIGEPRRSWANELRSRRHRLGPGAGRA